MSQSSEQEKLPLIGRDYALVENLAKQINKQGLNGHSATNLSRDAARRGFEFLVQIHHEGKPTGHIARVSVTLDRVEQEPAS